MLYHWTSGSSHFERTAVPSLTVWPWRWCYDALSGGNYTPNKTASHPKRHLFNFWENHLANMTYCKPHVSTPQDTNIKIFQNQLSLAFQFSHHHICLCHSYFGTNNSAFEVHFAMTQQLSDINQHEDVFSCMCCHYMVQQLCNSNSKETADCIRAEVMGWKISCWQMGEQGTSVKTNNRGGVDLVATCGLPFTKLCGNTHQLSHRLVYQHLVFATAQMKQCDCSKWKYFLRLCLNFVL